MNGNMFTHKCFNGPFLHFSLHDRYVTASITHHNIDVGHCRSKTEPFGRQIIIMITFYFPDVFDLTGK